MAASSSKTLLHEIVAYLARTGMSQTRFGEEVMNNRSFVSQLRGGGGVTARTLDKVRGFMTRYPNGKMSKRRKGSKRGAEACTAA